MYSHASFWLTSCFHCFMDMMPPHALAPILREKGGMKIDHATRKSLNEEVGYQGKETCQDDEMNIIFAQKGQYHFRIVKFSLRNHNRWYT